MATSNKENLIAPHNHEMLKDLFWGCIGGLGGTIASHPLDTIRVRLQLQCSIDKAYHGIVDWGIKTVRKEGFGGLFKGITPIAVSQWPIYALIFAGKEYGMRQCNKYTNYSDDVKSLISGCIGGAVSTIVAWPAELLKIKSQSNTRKATNYLKLTRKMVKNQGVLSLYKGYLCTLIRDVPAFAVYFGIFDIGCHHFLKPSDSIWKVLSYQLVFGSLAGMASWWITYAFDVAKTIIQNSDKHITIRRAFIEGYKKYGLRFFFKGMGCSSLWAIPMDATCLILYTQLHQRL